MGGLTLGFDIVPEEGDDPGDLLDYALACKGKSPHVDPSLVKRPRQTPEEDAAAAVTLRDDERWVRIVSLLVRKFVGDCRVTYKKRGFRISEVVGGIDVSLVNVDSVRELKSGVIKASVTFPQVKSTEDLSVPAGLPAPKQKRDNGPVTLPSANLIAALRWFDAELRGRSEEAATEFSRLVNAKTRLRG